MGAILPFALFGAFMAYFAWRARREGLSTGEWVERREARSFDRPGWWRVPAIGAGVISLLYVGGVTLMDGFRPESLLIVPLVALWLVASVGAVTLMRRGSSG